MRLSFQGSLNWEFRRHSEGFSIALDVSLFTVIVSEISSEHRIFTLFEMLLSSEAIDKQPANRFPLCSEIVKFRSCDDDDDDDNRAMTECPLSLLAKLQL